MQLRARRFYGDLIGTFNLVIPEMELWIFFSTNFFLGTSLLLFRTSHISLNPLINHPVFWWKIVYYSLTSTPLQVCEPDLHNRPRLCFPASSHRHRPQPQHPCAPTAGVASSLVSVSQPFFSQHIEKSLGQKAHRVIFLLKTLQWLLIS